MGAIMLILWKLIFYMFGKYFRVFSSISEIRTSSEHERTKNDIFELRASTNVHFSERERASIKRFEVRHNTTLKLNSQFVYAVVKKIIKGR